MFHFKLFFSCLFANKKNPYKNLVLSSINVEIVNEIFLNFTHSCTFLHLNALTASYVD